MPATSPPFDPATDLKIAFHFRGPSVTPEFFPYDLHHLSGLLRYQYGRVEMLDFSARHGATTLKLGAADVRFADGGVWANLGNVQVSPLVADAQFLKALPARLRGGFEQLNVRGSAELNVKHMVISVPGPNAAGGRPRAPASTGVSRKPPTSSCSRNNSSTRSRNARSPPHATSRNAPRPAGGLSNAPTNNSRSRALAEEVVGTLMR